MVTIDLPDLIIEGVQQEERTGKGSNTSLRSSSNGGGGSGDNQHEDNVGSSNGTGGKVKASSTGAAMKGGSSGTTANNSSTDRGVPSSGDVENHDGKKRNSNDDKKSPLTGVELDVAPRTLDLKVPGVYRLHLDMPFPVDADRITAKFRKKKATLTVSAHEL